MIGHPWQLFGGQTFSQHGEDLLFCALFHHLGIPRPSYLDIGCQDPVIISNTALLYARGSRGINIDCDPNCIARFREQRPYDINIVAGVGAERGRLPFFRLGERGSFVRAMMEPHGIEEEIMVDVVTLTDVIDRFASGVFPHLLSIDIEGFDAAVLASFNFPRTSPVVICAEGICDGHDFHAPIAEVLTKAGYFLYAWMGANMIFTRESDRHAIYS